MVFFVKISQGPGDLPGGISRPPFQAFGLERPPVSRRLVSWAVGVGRGDPGLEEFKSWTRVFALIAGSSLSFFFFVILDMGGEEISFITFFSYFFLPRG